MIAAKTTRRRSLPRPPSVTREVELHQTLAPTATVRLSRTERPSQPRKPLFQATTQTTLQRKIPRKRLLLKLPQPRKLQSRRLLHQMTQVTTHPMMSQRRRPQLLRPHQQRRPQQRKLHPQMKTVTLPMMSQRRRLQLLRKLLPRKPLHPMTVTATAMFKS